MSKKLLLILAIIVAISFIILISINYYKKHSVSYNIDRLKNGSTGEKIRAATFMSDNKITEAIPLLIENVDNQNRDFWDKEPKGGRIDVSCVVTYALNNITNNNIGDTCYEYSKPKGEYERIKQTWKDWYKNEYKK